MKLGKNIFGVGAMTGISRVFGFIRDMLIARFLGAGRLSDIFFAAFKLPNLFRDLLYLRVRALQSKEVQYGRQTNR